MKKIGIKLLIAVCGLLHLLASAYGGSVVLTTATYMSYGPGPFDTVRMGAGQTVTTDNTTGWVISGRLDSASFPYHELNYGPGRSTRFLENSLISFSGGYVSDGYMNNPGTSVQLYYGSGHTATFYPGAHIKFSGGFVSDGYLLNTTAQLLYFGSSRTAYFNPDSHITFSSGYVTTGYLSSSTPLAYSSSASTSVNIAAQVQFTPGQDGTGYLARAVLASSTWLQYGPNRSAIFRASGVFTSFRDGYVANGVLDVSTSLTALAGPVSVSAGTVCTFTNGFYNNGSSAPVFTTQPISQTVTAGNTVAFSSLAIGSPNTPTYQWKKNGINIAGATNSAYSIASVNTADAGFYSVVASNSVGTTSSNSVPLYVNSGGNNPGTVTGGANSALYNGTDTSTQGNWNGVYGTDGYDVFGASASIPAYASVSYSYAADYTWAYPDGNSNQALQIPGAPTSRIAACKYSGAYGGNSFVVDVNVSGGVPKPVSLYLLDWDGNNSRAETVYALNGDTGEILNTQSNVGAFSGGKWLKYSVTGHVKFTIVLTAADNAVLSGVFFGEGGGAVGNTATFSGTDTSTQGNWTGVYGTDGYDVFGASASLPAYASVSYASASDYTWGYPDGSSTRALQIPGAPTSRIAACKYTTGAYGNSFVVDVNVGGGIPKQVSLYLLDWDGNNSRAETVQALDGDTGAVLNTQSNVGSFSGGKWLKYNVTGHVKFTVTLTASDNAVLSGVFFQ